MDTSSPGVPALGAGNKVSKWAQFNALNRKNWTLKRRHPCALCCELILPIIFLLLLSALKGKGKDVQDIMPPSEFPVPPLSFLLNQTAYPYVLCNDDNPFLLCDCSHDKPATATVDGSISDYYSKQLKYPVESMFNMVHSQDAYIGLCISLVEQSVAAAANVTTSACTLTQLVYDFCPRLIDGGYTGDSLTPLVTACGGITSRVLNDVDNSTATIRAAILQAEAGGAGVTIPADQIASHCVVRNLAVVPTPADGVATTAAETAALGFQTYLATAAPGISYLNFEKEKDFTNYIKQSGYGRNDEIPVLAAGVVFEDAGPAWQYKLRFNDTKGLVDGSGNGYYYYNTPITSSDTDATVKDAKTDSSNGGQDSFPFLQTYYVSGFLAFQQAIDTYILQSTNGAFPAPQYRVADFPSPAYNDSTFWASVGDLFALVLVLVLMYPVANVIKAIVVEKELKIKEGMLQMGLSPAIYTLSWVWLFFVIFLALSIVMAIIGGAIIFEHSDGIFVFLYFFLFLMATQALCFFLAAFFSKARTAATLGAMLFFVTLFPYFAVASNTGASTSARLGVCLLPTACFAVGTLPFVDYEDSGQGVTSDTYDTHTDATNISFQQVIIMFIVDIFLYSFLAWYAAQVVPSEWGTSRPWYFLVTKSYWRPAAAAQFEGRESILARDETQMDNKNIEQVADSLRRQVKEGRCVAIRDLSKVFQGEHGNTVMAVNQLNLTMYSGQITALLGHNGAGKTTTMNMLTGMIPITGGNAIVLGKDARSEMQTVRQGLGVCPQHDILYGDLTVYEHLRMYAVFKGVRGRKKIRQEVESMIRAVGLTEKKHQKTAGLSGGQKRKLSVGIAFIGGSRVVFLDEPTSGMDPHSRRFTWDIIRRQKEGRIIVLTTHFMDEADLLGDRIAIMAGGQLKCCGSSLFLKTHYGVGYNLTVVKQVRNQQYFKDRMLTNGHEQEENGAMSPAKNSSGPIKALVKRHVRSAKMLSDVGAEVSFQLPSDTSGQFKPLLLDLDENMDGLGISSYGMSITTLEEVFLRVAHGTEEQEDRQQLKQLQRQRSKSDSMNIQPPEAVRRQSSMDSEMADVHKGAIPTGSAVRFVPEELSPYKRFSSHVKALLVKRAHTYKRDKKMMCFTLIAPMLFLLIGLIILQSTPSVTQGSLVLDAAVYNDGVPQPQTPLPYTLACFDATATCDYNTFLGDLPTSAKFGPEGLAVSGGAEFTEFSQELLDTRNSNEGSRYGAYSFYELDTTANVYDLTAHANYTALHAGPVFLNAASNALLKLAAGAAGAADTSSYGIRTVVHPMPATKYSASLNSDSDSTFVVLFFLIGLAFIPAAWAGFIVRERETKSKHQQVVSGVSLNAYWASTYMWDIGVYVFTPVVALILLKAFSVDALIRGGGLGPIFLLLFFFGPANAGFTYIFSFCFTKYANAMTTTLFVNWVLGLLLSTAIFIMSFFNSVREGTKGAKWFLRIFPPFCMGDGLYNLANRNLLAFIYGESGSLDPWDMNVCGADILYLAVEIVVFYLITLWVERAVSGTSTLTSFFADRALAKGLERMQDADNTLWNSDLQKGEGDRLLEDEDVVVERQRMQASLEAMTQSKCLDGDQEDVIKMLGLRKVYPTGKKLKVAVRGMWLGIPKGECFGLLGINGAGKTTTISMLCGETLPTQGHGNLAGVDVAEDPEAVHRLIGYCPQFDALFQTMTGREHLELYARIKGLRESDVPLAVEAAAVQFDLTKYVDKLAGGYSGGNKRKLSVAIAMLGNPELVFLDEPSTGVDPVARRFMWEVLTNIVTERKDCALVLTTHSMEECEALCQRIGVMVGGRLRCLGSAQHLKSRFGQGYQLEATVGLPSEEDIALAEADMSARVGGKDAVTSETELMQAMDAFPDLKTELSPTGTGYLVHQELLATKSLALRELASWALVDTACARVQQFMDSSFPGCELKEKQTAKMRYELPPLQGVSLGGIFGTLEDNRRSLGISDYALGQTSLEQIFNLFAAQQEEEQENAPGTGFVVKGANKGPIASARRVSVAGNDETKGDDSLINRNNGMLADVV